MVFLKEFEKKQTDWWCQYYQKNLKTLAIRTRQYLKGEIDVGLLEVMLEAVEKEVARRETLD